MLKCWDRKALEVQHMGERTQRQGEGEAKNSNKEIYESLSIRYVLWLLWQQVRLPLQFKKGS